MAEPTLLQQARETYDGTRPVLLGDVDARAFNVLRTAVGLLLQHLEQRESDARTLHTPGKPKPSCEVCGRPTGGCCTVMKLPGEVAYVDQSGNGNHVYRVAAEPRCYTDSVRMRGSVAGPTVQLGDANGPEQAIGYAAAPGDLDLDALQKLCDAAWPGPWHFDAAWCRNQVFAGPAARNWVICEASACGINAFERDGRFIAAARDALPKLIAEVRRLRAACLRMEQEPFGGEHG